MKRTRYFPTLAGVAAAAGVLAVAGTAALRAQEEPARPADAATDAPKAAVKETPAEAVARLFPDVLSDDAGVRERAERAIVALGDPARAELERIARDPDMRRAVAALRLLQSDRWQRAAPRAPGETDPAPRFTPPDFGRWRDDLEKRLDEMRQRMQEWEKQFDVHDWVPEVESEHGDRVERESSGSVVTNGKSLAWTIDGSGRVRVTTKDGPDAPETTVEAPDLGTLRKEHPDLAGRLDAVLPRSGFHRWTFTWPPRAFDRGSRDLDRQPQADPPREGEEQVAPLAPPAATPGPLLGVTWDALPDVLRDQIDVPEGGMVVLTVAPNTLASRLGLRRNDVLLTVAGRPVAGPADVRKALEGVPEGGSTAVEIVRKGRRETLSATR